MIHEIQYADFIEEKPFVKEWIDNNGKEVLSSKPVAVPVQLAPPPSSMMELLHRMYQSLKAEGHEVESPEDAEDFDVEDELGIEMRSTPYEQDFDHIAGSAAAPAEPPAVPAEPEKVTQ